MKHFIRGTNRFGLRVAVLALLGLAGCGSTVNQRNYDQLKVGMDYNQVLKILGKPAGCEAVMAVKNCVWGKTPGPTISVRFIADNVALFKAQGL